MSKRIYIETFTVAAGGGTDNIVIGSGADLYRIEASGSVALTSGYTVAATGTPAKGDYARLHYVADLNFDGNTVTILGATMPADLESVECFIDAYYTGSAWEVKFLPTFGASFITASFLEASSVDTSELAADAVTAAKIVSGGVDTDELASDAVTTVKITDANVTAAKLATNAVTTAKITDANVTTEKLETMLKQGAWVFEVSYETGEQTTLDIKAPFDGTIDEVYYTVKKAIAATDNGTLSFSIGGVSMTPASLTNTASEALGNTKATTITSGNAFSENDLIEFTTSKTTAGGKLLLVVKYTRT